MSVIKISGKTGEFGQEVNQSEGLVPVEKVGIRTNKIRFEKT